MKKVEILNPIVDKINYWLEYEKNKPKVPYQGNKKIHDEYRKRNDLDCQLTNSNLNADTIISLWLPLRLSLVKLNGYSKLNKIGNINNKIDFLSEITKHDLTEYLPIDDPIVIKLSQLFKRGIKRENVMISPNRRINVERAQKPYYDYVPHFLFECFQNGYFSKYFNSDSEFIKWIEQEHLEMFFINEEISKCKIKDLSGSGSIKNNIPINLEIMLDNYICVLKAREKRIYETFS